MSKENSMSNYHNGGDHRKCPLNVRVNLPIVDFDRYYTEKESTISFDTLHLDRERTALIVIDVWERHHNEGWFARAEENIRTKMLPLVDFIRKSGIPIIHIPHEFETYGIHPEVRPPDGSEPVVLRSVSCPKCQDVSDIFAESREVAIKDYDIDVLSRGLRDHDITTLLYAGYASNWCMLHRDAGIITMKKLGFNIVFVRDCSLAMEMPETLEGELAHKVITQMIECQYGPSTTLADLTEALDS